MATHDYVIANASGAAVRADLNNALAAIVSNNSSSTEPATTYAYMWWVDTANGQLKQRNAANDGWVTVRELDGTLLMEDGTAGAPGLSFASDLDTGLFRAGTNAIGIATNGVERVEFGTSEVVFNDGGNDIDFRIEGDTQANLFVVDAGNDSVSIGGDVTITDKIIHAGDTDTAIRFPAADVVAVETAGSEAARIDSSGRLLVGTSTALPVGSSSSALQIADSLGYQSLSRWVAAAGGPALVIGKSRGTTPGSYTIVQANDDLGSIFFAGDDGTDLISAGARISCQVDGTPGVNDMPGRLVFSTTADGASSPTERMRITSGGETLVGNTTVFSASSSTATGNLLHPDGYAIHFASGQQCLYLGRQTSDGSIVSIRQAGTEEGSISVSGTTVSYNGAHLSRWSQLPNIDPHDKDQRPEILRGTVMSNLDEMCDWTCPESGECQDNEQLNKTKISDVEGDKNVAGVFQSWDDDDDTWVNDFYLAMTGDFIIRIGAGVTVERGDLLMSAGDGTAKPQDDDIIRSKTIAKVTSTNVSCTYDDGSYCIPCVLMAC